MKFPNRVCATDHPRSRGVYVCGERIGANGEGSSPLARGLQLENVDPLDGGRIIPARAGFTGSPSHVKRAMHGSSPLARGLPFPGVTVASNAGIIPARAGFTGGYMDKIKCVSDHPRSRGVYTRMLALAQSPPGSSPLARGLQLQAPGTSD